MAEEDNNENMKHFDVIILGTGLKECILSGLLSSVKGQRVLQVDRNNFYGGESASLNLAQLNKKFRGDEKYNKDLGESNRYCIDLCPKFLMACGDLVKILLKTKVTEYLEFKSVTGSFVYKNGGIHKVPATPKEALASSLMGMFEKRRFKQFLTFCSNYEVDDKASHKVGKDFLDLNTLPASKLYAAFSLDSNTQAFTGHSIALFLDDTYLEKPAMDLVDRTKLYALSVTKYGNSPYIYPKWGLGGLPEGFSRRCAVYGGLFMLNMGEKQPFIEKVLFKDDGKVQGIRFGKEVSDGYEIPQEIMCDQLIADPSYFQDTDKVKCTGKVVRCIAIFNEPVPNTKKADACQIIIPGVQVGRKTDIYVCVVSHHHEIAPEPKYVAVMSAKVEGTTANPEDELAPALGLLPANLLEKFVWVSDSYEPTGDGTNDNCFLTSSYDATTHFETCTQEVRRMYETITGEPLNVDADPEEAK